MEAVMEKSTELTPRLAARKLGVSLYYIYQSLWAGKLPGRKVGKQWRIPAEAVDTRLKQRGA
jgi:excisionase family DNA binding protein